jgi:hypothetical protein
MINLRHLLKTKLGNSNIIHNNNSGFRIAAFISIPRNASNSIRKILELGKNRAQENTSSLIIYENHQRASILSQTYDLNNLFVFCFARNPYDRCVSWYEYHKNIVPYRSLSFSSWVKQGMPHHWSIQNQTDYVSEGISPLLQYNFIEQVKLDFVGRIGNFPDDLKKVVERLNMICKEKDITYRFSFSNKKVNTSSRIHEFEYYYNQQTKEIVYSLLKKDFEYWGYEK